MDRAISGTAIKLLALLIFTQSLAPFVLPVQASERASIPSGDATGGNAVSIQDGAFYINGKAVYMWSGDYPYYRDDVSNWANRLDKIKASGIRVVTCYIPWRHHAPEDPLNPASSLIGNGYDFTGATQPNRNVLGFIELCRQRGLMVIAKPGPFIHAETDFGGLPDYVQPIIGNPLIEPMMDSNNMPKFWGSYMLPAPYNQIYQMYCMDWFTRVTADVIAPNQYPTGPIIAVQCMNEGIYSQEQGSLTMHDYSPSAKQLYQGYLKEKYGDIAKYNDLHGTTHLDWIQIQPPTKWDNPSNLKAALQYLDWGDFSSYFVANLYLKFNKYMWDAGLKVPVINNINPPLNGGSSPDYWFSRYNIERYKSTAGVNYGYTSWVGLPSHDDAAYSKYMIVGMRARGSNMEENWAYAKLYAPDYVYIQPCYFQSMLFSALGSTGINVYTMVGTSWYANNDNNIDTTHEAPMPSNSPIKDTGELDPKYNTIKQLSQLFDSQGPSLIDSTPKRDIAWGSYPPYSYAASWTSDHVEWINAGLSDAPRNAFMGLDAFINGLRQTDGEGAIVNIRDSPLSELQKYKAIFMAGGEFMDTPTQQKMLEYVNGGGALVMSAWTPRMDENFQNGQSAGILRENLFYCDTTKRDVSGENVVSVSLSGGENVRTKWWYQEVAIKGDAIPIATIGNSVVGYETRYGAGKAIFLGWHPWYTKEVEQNSAGDVGKVVRWACKRAGCNERFAWDAAESELVDVWERQDKSLNISHVFVVSREDAPKTYRIYYTDTNGQRQSFHIRMAAYSIGYVALENGMVKTAMIKATNDHDKSRIPPIVETSKFKFGAQNPCDLLIYWIRDNVYGVSAANLDSQISSTTVFLRAEGFSVERVVSLSYSGNQSIPVSHDSSGFKFSVKDISSAENYEITLIQEVAKKKAWYEPGLGTLDVVASLLIVASILFATKKISGGSGR